MTNLFLVIVPAYLLYRIGKGLFYLGVCAYVGEGVIQDHEKKKQREEGGWCG